MSRFPVLHVAGECRHVGNAPVQAPAARNAQLAFGHEHTEMIVAWPAGGRKFRLEEALCEE